MNHAERRKRRFALGAEYMSADERRAMERAIWAALYIQNGKERRRMMDFLADIGAAKGRAAARKASDKKTDARRRLLVGARLPREEAERCRRCAEKQGISLYRFTVNALRRECERAGQAPLVLK